MTIPEIAQLIYDTWTADADAGLVSPITTRVQLLLLAQCTAIATAIYIGGGGGGYGGSGAPVQQSFTGPAATLTLSHSPILSSLMLFRNGVFETGWSCTGSVLTPASPLTSDDVAVVRFQHLVLV